MLYKLSVMEGTSFRQISAPSRTTAFSVIRQKLHNRVNNYTTDVGTWNMFLFD